MSQPTYKELIQLLDGAERDSSATQSTAELLAARFCHLYPHITISRPGRFLETVRRIEGPIRSGKLKGPSRKLYMRRHWTPRTRNTVMQGMQFTCLYSNCALFRNCGECDVIMCFFILIDSVPFPEELSSRYGLTIEVLSNMFGCGEDDVPWCVQGIPAVGFYRMLHKFLKKWAVTRTLTKTSIGKFYLGIDERLQDRRSNPCNTYRFVDQIVSSDIPDSALMSYGLDKQLGSLQAEIRECRDLVQDLNVKVEEQQAEICLLRHEVERKLTKRLELLERL